MLILALQAIIAALALAVPLIGLIFFLHSLRPQMQIEEQDRVDQERAEANERRARLYAEQEALRELLAAEDEHLRNQRTPQDR